MGFGDGIHAALEMVGVTEERVRKWLGHACQGCKERRDRLNALGWWARRVLTGKTADAVKHLDNLMEEQPDE
jgi:hypothetical protein